MWDNCNSAPPMTFHDLLGAYPCLHRSVSVRYAAANISDEAVSSRWFKSVGSRRTLLDETHCGIPELLRSAVRKPV